MDDDATRVVGRTAAVVAALGVVFGDIGTSPIYTLQTAFDPGDPHPIQASLQSVYGVVSLIFWSVTLIVTVKYVGLVMKADKRKAGAPETRVVSILVSNEAQRSRIWPYRNLFSAGGFGLVAAKARIRPAEAPCLTRERSLVRTQPRPLSARRRKTERRTSRTRSAPCR
jgi:K+ transporter